MISISFKLTKHSQQLLHLHLETEIAILKFNRKRPILDDGKEQRKEYQAWHKVVKPKIR